MQRICKNFNGLYKNNVQNIWYIRKIVLYLYNEKEIKVLTNKTNKIMACINRTNPVNGDEWIIATYNGNNNLITITKNGVSWSARYGTVAGFDSPHGCKVSPQDGQNVGINWYLFNCIELWENLGIF